jgi:hypothetical protein
MNARRKERPCEKPKPLRLIEQHGPAKVPRQEADDEGLAYADLLERLAAEELRAGPRPRRTTPPKGGR